MARGQTTFVESISIGVKKSWGVSAVLSAAGTLSALCLLSGCNGLAGLAQGEDGGLVISDPETAQGVADVGSTLLSAAAALPSPINWIALALGGAGLYFGGRKAAAVSIDLAKSATTMILTHAAKKAATASTVQNSPKAAGAESLPPSAAASAEATDSASAEAPAENANENISSVRKVPSDESEVYA